MMCSEEVSGTGLSLPGEAGKSMLAKPCKSGLVAGLGVSFSKARGSIEVGERRGDRTRSRDERFGRTSNELLCSPRATPNRAFSGDGEMKRKSCQQRWLRPSLACAAK